MAASLGDRALQQGLHTLDLARIHEQALLVLAPAKCTPAVLRRMRKQSGPFFLAALQPLEQSHQELKREIGQREAAETALAKKEQRYRLLLEQSRIMERRLRRLSHQVLSAQEAERKKISRELHDQIAQMLAGINVHLSVLKNTAAVGHDGFNAKIKNTQRLVEKSVKTVHHFARALRPPALDDLGLIPAFTSSLNDFRERTGLQVRLTAFAGVEALHNDKRTVLFRVVQAALTNISQHAQASTVSLTISRVGDAVQLHLRDDGRGFDVDPILLSPKTQRLGLIGMRERVEMVGGRFSVTSAPGAGTTIRVQLPFQARRKLKRVGP